MGQKISVVLWLIGFVVAIVLILLVFGIVYSNYSRIAYFVTTAYLPIFSTSSIDKLRNRQKDGGSSREEVTELRRGFWLLERYGPIMGAGGGLAALLVGVAFERLFDGQLPILNDIQFLSLSLVTAALFVVGGEVYLAAPAKLQFYREKSADLQAFLGHMQLLWTSLPSIFPLENFIGDPFTPDWLKDIPPEFEKDKDVWFDQLFARIYELVKHMFLEGTVVLMPKSLRLAFTEMFRLEQAIKIEVDNKRAGKSVNEQRIKDLIAKGIKLAREISATLRKEPEVPD